MCSEAVSKMVTGGLEQRVRGLPVIKWLVILLGQSKAVQWTELPTRRPPLHPMTAAVTAAQTHAILG